MTTDWQKFKLLTWKNWLIQRRHPLQTLVEIIVPVLFSIILIIIRGLVDPEIHNEATTYKPLYLKKLDLSYSMSVDKIGWSPSNKELSEIISLMRSNINNDLIKFLEFDNATNLENELVTNNKIIGIEFLDSYKDLKRNDERFKNLTVSIRFPATGIFKSQLNFGVPSTWMTTLLFPVYQIPGPRVRNSSDGGYPPGYNNEGFLTIQNELSMALLSYLKTNSTKFVPKIQLQRFPYGSYIDDPLISALQSFVSLVFMLSFVYTSISNVRMITIEKERQLKEAMKIMGLPSWLHWTAWFLKCLCFSLISIILVTILVTIHWQKQTNFSVFTFASPFVIFLLLFVYMCATITFCFMVSVFFSKANTAATIAGFIWFVSYAPFTFVQPKYEELTLGRKLFLSLFHNTGMAFGFQLIIMKEGSTEGMQLDNIWTPMSTRDNFVLGHVLIMLILDALIYLVIALYVEKILPGEYGIPLPWYYPFQLSYWKGYNGNDTVIENGGGKHTENITNFEEEPNNLKVGIKIENLYKSFGNNKMAVNKLSLNIYQDQITVLLGHNGAGKTTTMSILTGIIPPTSGTAYIYNMDIRKNINSIRQFLGLCPQHNVLFDELTVEEHIEFFSLLKGIDNDKIKEEIDKYVKLLDLVPKRKNQSQTLSGGMKRKLSVGVALCGGSKIIILDEPTSGMDPAARRALWDLLKIEKKDRTILLTTHFMDEADLLGDRIAIMSLGRLQCCGSSFFLKKHFGTGYHLIMDKENNCQVNEITRLLNRHIDGIEPTTDIGSELTYILPETYVDKFEALLKDLEENGNSLGVNSFGISLTSLEEVFIKVGSEHVLDEESNDESDGKNRQNNKIEFSQYTIVDNNTLTNTNQNSNNLLPDMPLLTGPRLYVNHFLAMLVKKMLITFRQWKLFGIQIFLSFIFIIIAMLAVRSWRSSNDLPPLPITLNSYQDCVAVINNYDSSSNKLANLVANPNQISNDLKTASKSLDLNETKNYIRKSDSTAIMNELPESLRNYLLRMNITNDYIEQLLGQIPDEYINRYMESFKKMNLTTLVNKNTKNKRSIITDILGVFDYSQVSYYYERINDEKCKLKFVGRNKGMDTFLLDEFEKVTAPVYRKIYLVGARISNTQLQMWFNNEPYHTSPLSLNLIHNALLKAFVGTNYQINVINKPLPYDYNTKMKLRGASVGFQLAFNLCFSMAFVSAFYVLYQVREQASRAKHLQFVSGAKAITYWAATFIWDFITFLICIAAIIITFLVCQQEGFRTSAELGRISLILVLFAYAMLPMMYLWSFIFDTPSTAFSRTAMFNIFASNAATIVVEILAQPVLDLVDLSKTLEWIFLFVPHFALGSALNNFDKVFTAKKVCVDICSRFPFDVNLCYKQLCEVNKYCCAETIEANYFAWKAPGSGRNVTFLLGVGTVFIVLLLLIDFKVFDEIIENILNFFRKNQFKKIVEAANDVASSNDFLDDDVQKEKEIIRKLSNEDLSTYGLVIKDMTKIYSNGFLAVKQLCIGINKHECFGLLGVNGAGKTTTFQMLTGGISITSGDAYINGYSVRSDTRQVQKIIGYCPQFDALLEDLTVRENLLIFCMLRGIAYGNKAKFVCEYLARELDFYQHYTKTIRQLSGGNKRKVSTAVAVLSNPQVVFLDEPTTGMDPVTKRHLWNFVCQIRDSGHSVILTSHNMEECEALCTRLAIMVNGNFKCLGSVQHLKQKFASGYTLTVKVNNPELEVVTLTSRISRKSSFSSSHSMNYRKPSTSSVNATKLDNVELNEIKRFICDNFSTAVLREAYNGLLTYQISPNESKTWSQMFGIMQNAKRNNKYIEDYSIGQSTLEQVFLTFTKKQTENVMT